MGFWSFYTNRRWNKEINEMKDNIWYAEEESSWEWIDGKLRFLAAFLAGMIFAVSLFCFGYLAGAV